MTIEVVSKVTECVGVGKKRESITFGEHWNWKDSVVMKVGDKEFVFVANDLFKAIKNALNAHQ